MKKWIGIFGPSNSGLKTKEEAQAWCGQKIAEGSASGRHAGTRAFLCEAVEEVKLLQPATEAHPFVPLEEATQTHPVAKAA